MVDTPEVKKRRFTKNDWNSIVDFIVSEFQRRKGHRTNLEHRWHEIDRQVAMTPASHNRPGWIPNLELPLQAEALELLNADARRLMFPPGKGWFEAHTSQSEDDLRRLDFQRYTADTAIDPIAREIDKRGPQEFSNMVVKAVLERYHEQYDFRGAWDLINTEAFKYGTTAPKMRAASRDTFTNEFRGVIKDTERLPVLTPVSIKQTYLDDAPSRVAGEGFMIEPSPIRSWFMDLNDLAMAASKGSTDPTKENGGWMPKNLRDVEPMETPQNHVHVLEYEGDLVVPRSSGPSIFVPNVIVSVVLGGGGLGTVFRFREKEFGFRSGIPVWYHRDDVDSVYGVSPLIKGAPIQESATAALNLLMATAHIRVNPPLVGDPNDFHRQGEDQEVEPGARLEFQGKLEALEIGDINGMLAVYQMLLAQYAEVTGITAPRLGQQTKSHQTAFAIDTEQTRGVVRTVDYVRNVANGPLQSMLHMEYEMAKKLLKSTQIYVPELNGYIEISGKQLPKFVNFGVHGAGGPLEEREKEQKELNAIRAFASLEPLARQLGERPGDFDEIRRRILRMGGIVETEALFGQQAQNAAPQPAGTGAEGSSGLVPEDAFAAVEGI